MRYLTFQVAYKRYDRLMRELALEHAAARLDDAEYLTGWRAFAENWRSSGRSRHGLALEA